MYVIPLLLRSVVLAIIVIACIGSLGFVALSLQAFIIFTRSTIHIAYAGHSDHESICAGI